MTELITIYYDNVPNYGVNATCVHWAVRNEYFKSMSELTAYVLIEHGTNVEYVEITAQNYEQLCLDGVFYDSEY